MIAQDEYLETRVMTAPPHVLHLMVLDGAIRHARNAERELSDGDHEAAHGSLNAAREFVAELIAGLDRDRSPDLVDSLHGLFGFVYRNLVRADPERNLQLVRDGLRILERHRETWVALSEQLQLREGGEATDGVDRQPPESASREWSG